MLDALGVAVCLADEDELLYVNEAFERLTGWSAEAALGCGDVRTVLGEVERPGRSLVTVRRPDGASVQCELTFTEVAGGDCWAGVLVQTAGRAPTRRR